jgi:nucleotide-binding universal stress UspA family protein
LEVTVFTRIVVGCDGGAPARDAVALAHSVAQVTGAGLSLVGVYPTAFFPVPGQSDRRSLRAQAEQVLHRERDRFAPEAHTDTVVDLSFARGLRRFGQRWHAGLIVIGSDRQAADGRAAISRRGRQVVIGARCPVLIAARGLHEHPARLRAIGVGFDGGPESVAAMHVAVELARATGARLQVRRVVEDQIPPLSADQWIASADWRQFWEPARESAQAVTTQELEALGVDAGVSVTVGDPGYELRSLSEEVDLIVVGSRRWGPKARIISGGVGETLVADAGCSVLIVPRVSVSDPPEPELETEATDAASAPAPATA